MFPYLFKKHSVWAILCSGINEHIPICASMKLTLGSYGLVDKAIGSYISGFRWFEIFIEIIRIHAICHPKSKFKLSHFKPKQFSFKNTNYSSP